MGNVDLSKMRNIMILTVCFAWQLTYGQETGPVEPVLRDVISLFPNVRDFTISSNEDEAYFTAQSNLPEISIICMVKKIGHEWQKPEIVSFSGQYQDLEPFLSPDELRLYFASNRPLSDSTTAPKDFDIWYVSRENKKADWSAPINVGAPVNSEHNEFYPAVSSANTMYFTCDARDTKGKDDILRSAWLNESYTEPVSMSESINSEGYEFNAYVSPDESLIVFSGYNRPDGFGGGDMYLSKRQKDGSWGPAKNLGPEINSEKTDYCPYVNWTTKTLYFTSRRSTVSNKTGFTKMDDLLEELGKFEDGSSRIYKVSATEIIK